MPTDIDEVNKIIKEKELKTNKETEEVVGDAVRDLPFAKQNVEDMVKMRGKVMEASTHIEEVFNQTIIALERMQMFGNIIFSHVFLGEKNLPKEVYDPEYVKNKLDKDVIDGKITDTFRKKAGYMKTLIEKSDPTKIYSTKLFIKKFNQLVNIRNRFAHVPIGIFTERLEFSSEAHFNEYFTDEPTREAKPHYDHFGELYNEILAGLRKYFDDLEESRKPKKIDLGFEPES
jgi:hypothetical protein